MKTAAIFLPLLALYACKQVFQKNTTSGSGSFTASQSAKTNGWAQQTGITLNSLQDSIWEQPVQYYLDRPGCSPLALRFYEGNLPLHNSDSVVALFALTTTADPELRPFYRWCLTKAMQLPHIDLAELAAAPARSYAESFPNEFFYYMDQDGTGDRYRIWADAIGYGGYTDTSTESYTDARAALVRHMKKNCRSCNEEINQRIFDFATDCYPQ